MDPHLQYGSGQGGTAAVRTGLNQDWTDYFFPVWILGTCSNQNLRLSSSLGRVFCYSLIVEQKNCLV